MMLAAQVVQDAIWSALIDKGPLVVVLVIAVIYFARKQNQADKSSREDRTLLVTTLETTKAALIEFRRSNEILTEEIRDLKGKT